MDRVVRAVGWCIEVLLRPLDALSPWVSLAIIGALTAAAMLAVIRWTSPQRRIRHARAQVASAIFEMRLYLDHPLQLLRAQARLIGWSLAYVAYLLPSMVVLAGPLGLLYLHLEARHGVAPLAADETVIVRIELAPNVSLRDVSLEPDDGLAVTATVRTPDEPAVYARVKIRRAGTHTLQVHAGDDTLRVSVVADPDADVISPERHQGIAQLWAVGADAPIAGDAIEAVAIAYPDRPSPVRLTWWLYWFGVATAVAMLLKKRVGVEV